MASTSYACALAMRKLNNIVYSYLNKSRPKVISDK